MLKSLRKIQPANLRQQALPGWRLHKLQTSPFLTLSLDMNYRVLAKIEGENAYIHRVVKHSLADSPQVNRNDKADTPFSLEGSMMEPKDVFSALVALGLSHDYAKPFKDVKNDDDLLEVLSQADETLASFALAVYETSGLVVPRTKYRILQDDKDLESALFGSQGEWEIYLHPSQQYVATLPVEYRLSVSGSAGTGKTVCAWHRLQYLAQQGFAVGFVCPNQSSLKVSRNKIEHLLKASPVDCYFLVPNSATQLTQLAAEVKHVIVDEGQEFSPGWYQALGQCLRTQSTGITIFYDLNQLGGNIESGDVNRYKQRLEAWHTALHSIPKCNSMQFYVNYRNSREIARYYCDVLEAALPEPIRSEIPVFESGEVVVQKAKDPSQLPAIVGSVIDKLKADFKTGEIGIVCVGGAATRIDHLCQSLPLLGIQTTTDLDSTNGVLITKPEVIRGHERKAVIVCMPSNEAMSRKWGKAIRSYIALSRARDRLIIIEISGT